MADRETIRVVLVSPGDVAEEREAVVRVVDALNRRAAPSRGCELSLWMWENDAPSRAASRRAKGCVDARMEIDRPDIVVGIFWKRLGTPTTEAQSGTEYELRRALAAWKKHGRPNLMVYFSEPPAAPQTPAEAEQWLPVLEFRDELPGLFASTRPRSRSSGSCGSTSKT